MSATGLLLPAVAPGRVRRAALEQALREAVAILAQALAAVRRG